MRSGEIVEGRARLRLAGYLGVLALIGGFVAAPLLAAAQDVGQGGIVVEPLEPLTPPDDDAVADGDEKGQRFKPAPFRTMSLPMAPELIETVETTRRSGALLRELDKMTGRTWTFEIAAGEVQLAGRLEIRLEVCRAPDDDAQHGTMAFLQIRDTKHADAELAFSGWMFAESPALSALDHPRFDVWVINCTTSPGEVPAASE